MKFVLCVISLLLFSSISYSQVTTTIKGEDLKSLPSILDPLNREKIMLPLSHGGLLKDTIDPKLKITGTWLEPKEGTNFLPAKQYEKTEWGIRLPGQVEEAIDYWISNQSDKNGGYTNTINPFDPDQLDLWAEVTFNGKKQRVNGFFYLDYKRYTSNPDKNMWDWKEQKTEYRFRIRFAPTETGLHTVKVFCKSSWHGDSEMDEFSFNVIPNSPSESFVSISPNKHYFQTADGKIIMPIGLNHNDLSYGCECDLANSDKCEECYFEGEEDICCGIGNGYRHRRGNGDDKQQLRSEIKERSLPLVSYIKRDQQLEQMKASGATAVRIWNDPAVCDIEFEHLTNYYDRQYQAWEFDRVFEKCHELNLNIEWCHMMHYMITVNSDGMARWDWGNTDNCGNADPTDAGCCYFQEFGKEGPLDFFSDPEAIKAYKKKVRYLIARWGYSSELFLIDLVSEINNVGGGETWDCIDEDGDGVLETWPHYNDKTKEHVSTSEPVVGKRVFPLYGEDPEKVHPIIGAWQIEMARYIKEDLQHSAHPISADYTGTAPMSGRDNNPCDDPYFDPAWNSPNIDVIAYSYYDPADNRFEKMARTSYQHLQCTNEPSPGQRNRITGMQPKTSFLQIDKPVVYAECGGSGDMDCDYSYFYKDMMAGPLSGHATAGMTWHQLDKTKHWTMMGNVAKFMKKFYIDAQDPGKEIWLPGHQFSSHGGAIDKKMKNGTNDKRSEVVYLERQTPEDPKYIGVIMNRTWNMKTAEKCYLPEEIRYHSSLNTATPVSWDNEKLRIEDAYTGYYIIQYYNPFTMEMIAEVENRCFDASLDLADYPTLGATLDTMPFCFFIAYKRITTWTKTE